MNFLVTVVIQHIIYYYSLEQQGQRTPLQPPYFQRAPTLNIL